MKSHISLAPLALLLVGCDPSNNPGAVNNTVLVTISGEAAATQGITFPPASGQSVPYFLDGWELHFEHVLVTVGRVTLAEGPESSAVDQSLTGDIVAEATGPWAVDLARRGTLEAKEGNGTAIPLTRMVAQNKKSGSPSFDALSKYAFGYDLVPATLGAQEVNLEVEGQAAYRMMAEKGWSIWLKGTARWLGDATGACRTTDSSYDFGRFPQELQFAFGFNIPTSYLNCENPELEPEGARGVQTRTNAETVAQITLHLDHPFWEALEEDAPLRWDAIAARKSAATAPGPMTASITEGELDFDFQSVKDAQGNHVPWRTCGPTFAQERTSGTVAYDPVNVPVSPAGGAAGLKNLADYIRHNLSTFGHLNNDGLCFPVRQYPSPP